MSNATGSVVKQLSHVLLDGTLSIENRLVKLITMAVVAVLAVVVVVVVVAPAADKDEQQTRVKNLQIAVQDL